MSENTEMHTLQKNTTDIAVLMARMDSSEKLFQERHETVMRTIQDGFRAVSESLKAHADDGLKTEAALNDKIHIQGVEVAEQKKDITKLNRFMWGAVGAGFILEAGKAISAFVGIDGSHKP